MLSSFQLTTSYLAKVNEDPHSGGVKGSLSRDLPLGCRLLPYEPGSNPAGLPGWDDHTGDDGEEKIWGRDGGSLTFS